MESPGLIGAKAAERLAEARRRVATNFIFESYERFVS